MLVLKLNIIITSTRPNFIHSCYCSILCFRFTKTMSLVNEEALAQFSTDLKTISSVTFETGDEEVTKEVIVAFNSKHFMSIISPESALYDPSLCHFSLLSSISSLTGIQDAKFGARKKGGALGLMPRTRAQSYHISMLGRNFRLFFTDAIGEVVSASGGLLYRRYLNP